jgi:bifunctional DNA-binding transcriptional regulator/antitoxin component of YhaV-PrlF toxin-antitoxin module
VRKVTTEVQLTLPEHLADSLGLKPGDSVQWKRDGVSLRLVRSGRSPSRLSTADRLKLFDAATLRLEAARRGTHPNRSRKVVDYRR